MDKLFNLHKIIKELRIANKLTQKQIAEKMGIAYQSYQAYEMGIAVPTLKNLVKLCEILEVTPNDLLEY